jgi:hypothetical protein
MDDGSGVAKKAVVILTGFLVLAGAGCSEVPKKQTPSQEEDVKTSEAAPEITAQCYAAASLMPADYPEMQIGTSMRIYRPASDTSVFDMMAEDLNQQLKGHFQSGWNVDRFCVTTSQGKRIAYFSLYGFYGDALEQKTTFTIPEAATKALTPMRLGYMEEGGSLELSEIFTLQHSESAPVARVDLLRLDTSPERLVIAPVSNPKWSYQVSFSPAKNSANPLLIKNLQ